MATGFIGWLSFVILVFLALLVIPFVLPVASSFALKFARYIKKNIKLPLPVQIFVMDDWRLSTMISWYLKPWVWSHILKLGAL